jgi:general secretion pathway protein N
MRPWRARGEARPAARREPGFGTRPGAQRGDRAARAGSAAAPPWQRARRAARRWALAGLLCGALGALVTFAPARWLAAALAAHTGQRLLLADARGTVWNGNAVAVLSGGADSRSATLLPGRVHWQLAPRGLALELRVSQPCCMADAARLQLRRAWAWV